jgi:group I intron endonuclease
MSGVYVITNSVNGKCYIGSAVNIPKRWIKHRTELKTDAHHCAKLRRAYIKYGVASFVYSVLFYCNKKDLLFYEQRTINAFDSVKNGYNVNPTAGSRLGAKSSPEHCANISKALTGRIMSAEWRANIGAVQKGKPRPCSPKRAAAISAAKKAKGFHPSDETKARISATLKGRPCLESTKIAVSLRHTGKKRSAEEVAKGLATRAANRLKKSLT